MKQAILWTTVLIILLSGCLTATVSAAATTWLDNYNTRSESPDDSIPFAPQVTYPTGDSCIQVICVDLDKDNDSDLVTTNKGSDNISILWNVNGVLQPKIDYSVGIDPTYIRAGDLDGDGDLDLAVANWHGSTISILKNDNNTFTNRTDYPAGGSPIALSLGDVDHDGDLDIAVANHEESIVTVLENDGNGVFSLQASFSVSTSPFSAELVNIDGDNDLDIVTACVQGDVRTFINDGFGNFTAGPIVPVGSWLRWPACADIDRDGDIDVLVPNLSPPTIIVLLNDGAGNLSVSGSYTTGTEPVHVCSADFDQDGILDIAVANAYEYTVSIMRGNGDGTYLPQTKYTVGHAPHCVAPGDLDGDGDLDLTAANCYSGQNISVLENLSLTMAGFWKFDETDPLIAYDSSGRDNDGTLTNGPLRVPGKVGGALQFDGIDDYVIVPDDPSLDISGPFTCMAWIKPDIQPYQMVSFVNKWFNYILQTTTNGPNRLRLIFYDGQQHVIESTDNILRNGEWQHVAGTWDGDSLKLFLNGEEIGVLFVGPGHVPSTFDNPLYIGTEFANAQFFRGTIDEVQVYSSALSGDEILRLFDQSCCVDWIGDVNNDGADMPTIGDISVLIDVKFISGTCVGKIACLTEADANQSGGATPVCDDLTISDISILIDCLFITGPDTYVRKACL
jgi:hypothetical protein